MSFGTAGRLRSRRGTKESAGRQAIPLVRETELIQGRQASLTMTRKRFVAIERLKGSCTAVAGKRAYCPGNSASATISGRTLLNSGPSTAYKHITPEATL